jgi:2-phosphosulfolactate phosphatase
MITALANGAAGIIPVAEIREALALRTDRPDLLLAGERNGLRIQTDLTGGAPFDLGNSPREFSREKVNGRVIAMTTTNGTRALRACSGARSVLVGSFLNLSDTASRLEKEPNLLVVCSGTFEQAAYEDVLGAGALCDLIWGRFPDGKISDSARMARDLYLLAASDLLAALGSSRNGRRLLDQPDLRDDVSLCAQRDVYPVAAALWPDGTVRRLP